MKIKERNENGTRRSPSGKGFNLASISYYKSSNCQIHTRRKLPFLRENADREAQRSWPERCAEPGKRHHCASTPWPTRSGGCPNEPGGDWMHHQQTIERRPRGLGQRLSPCARQSRLWQVDKPSGHIPVLGDKGSTRRADPSLVCFSESNEARRPKAPRSMRHYKAAGQGPPPTPHPVEAVWHCQ